MSKRLKKGDIIKCDKFKYVRHFTDNDTFIFDYKDYYYNEDGSWNKGCVTRERMDGEIIDDITNSEAEFKVIKSIKIKPFIVMFNQKEPGYTIYYLRKISDNKYPIITMSDTNIDRTGFNLDYITIINRK